MTLQLEGQFQAPHGWMRFQMVLTPSQVVALVGENGIGKSTLLRHLKAQEEHYFPKRSLGTFLQSPLRPLKGLRGQDYLCLLKEIYPSSSLPREEKWQEWVSCFGMREKLERPVAHLSGGENQLLKLLLLFYRPYDLYLLDEPSSFLDREKQALLKKWILEEKALGKSFLIIDHDRDFLSTISDQHYLLRRAEHGRFETVLQ